MSLPQRSQSALEYMMTYGWAILVIVIVAGVLYSLGIFSPSSAISSTVTGFSNLGSVTAQCIGNQGLTIQLGDSVGYTIQITNISVSASGKTVNMPEQATIAPSGIKVFYIPNVCPSPSSRYSLSVTVYYTEPGQIFPGPYTSTGTITGSSSKQQISSTPAFDQVIPLTITNSQDNSTPNPYQQMVIVPSSVYGGYAASNFQNVEFFYSNGSIVPSWLQNYTSTNATWWLKLSSISASSSKTVYMGFVPKSTNLFNTVNDGEANSAADDLSNVFPSSLKDFYFTGGNMFSFSNNYFGLGFVIKSIGNMAFSNTPYFQITNQNNNWNPWWEFYSPNNPPTSDVSTLIGDTPIPIQKLEYGFAYVYNLNSSTQATVEVTNGYTQFSVDPQYSTGFIPNGGRGINITFADIFQFSVPLYGMPSVSFGYPSNITKPANIQSYAPLTISNNQNVSVSNFQQMVNVPSSVFTGYANTASGTAFQNLEFFYANGTIIPSWLENYTSSNALYWIKLPSVPAETSFTVYLGFASTSTNLFNTLNDGEAPQLSSTYAEYDDGANVFNNYWNFAGTILPSGWTSTGGYSGSINNGLTVTSSSDYGGVISGSITASPPIILDVYEEVTSEQAANIGFSSSTSFSSTVSGYYNAYQYFQASGTSYTFSYIQYVTSSGTTEIVLSTLPIVSNTGYNVYSEIYTASSVAQFQNYVSAGSGSATQLSSASYVFAAVWVGATQKIQWLRTRAYPPNGVMPSVSFGSVS